MTVSGIDPIGRRQKPTAADAPALELVIVEDSPAYAQLVEAMLQSGWGETMRFSHFRTLGDAQGHLLISEPACVVLDLGLPDAQSLDALSHVLSASPRTPVVVLTGQDDEELGVQAVQLGAQDYLVKGRVNRELVVRSVRFAIERKRAELARHQALHDPLTGLPNRSLFLDRLALALARLDRRSGPVAVLFVDLDDFKDINDIFGHAGGDFLLVEVAGRIRDAIRPSDTVARLGGDEFLILCDEVGAAEEAIVIAQRVGEALSAPLAMDTREVSPSASIGVAVTSSPDAGPEAVVHNADTAMYRAKRRRTGLQLFDERMQVQLRERSELERALREGIELDRFLLLYQPLIRLDTETVFGFEALIRFGHPERGVLAAGDFLDVAEASGLIVPIGHWVLSSACQELSQRQQTDGPRLQVGVNLSARQLSDPQLMRVVQEALRRAHLEPWQLCLEFTQATIANDDEFTLGILRELKSLGVSLAVDDVWTGRSALSRMENLPLDLLKIDRSFVTGLVDDPRKRRIVSAVVGLAGALGLPAIAEGVESAEELAELRALGCTGAQGFLLGSPEE